MQERDFLTVQCGKRRVTSEICKSRTSSIVNKTDLKEKRRKFTELKVSACEQDLEIRRSRAGVASSPLSILFDF